MKADDAESINAKYRHQLKGPLQFGNAEQIKLLRSWLRELEQLEETRRKREDPNTPLTRWRVEYSFRETGTEYIFAKTVDEAEEKVDELHGHEDDFQIEYACAMPRSTTEYE